MSEDKWRTAYCAAFVRIAVERGYWDAEGAQPWAESCVADAHVAAGDCIPADVASEDVEVCAREKE